MKYPFYNKICLLVIVLISPSVFTGMGSSRSSAKILWQQVDFCTTKPATPDFNLVSERGVLWPLGITLNVWIESDDNNIRQRIIDYANLWTTSGRANLRFNFFGPNNRPDPVHISVRINGSRTYSSEIGIRSQGVIPSMVLGVDGEGEESIRRHTLHEFGHALGLKHEHQGPRAHIAWNEQAVFNAFPNWSQGEVRSNVLNQLREENTNSTSFDSASIMTYAIPASWRADGGPEIPWNTNLSTQDSSFIQTLYPFYMSDLKVIYDGEGVPDGFVRFNFDLNKGAGGRYIYICYKGTANEAEAIRDIRIKEGRNAQATSGYNIIRKDLNAGAGGAYLYLEFTKAENIGRPIRRFVIEFQGCPDLLQDISWRSSGTWVRRSTNLNLDTGADCRLYLWFRNG